MNHDDEICAMKAEIARLQQALEESENDREEMRLARMQDRKALETMINSTCWRMTAPVRFVLDPIKGRFGHTLVLRGLRHLKNRGIRQTARRVLERAGRAQETAGPTVYLPERLKEIEESRSGRRVLLISHELSLTGAPLVLLYFAQTLTHLGYQPVMIGPADGPMREENTKSGIPTIIDAGILQDGSNVVEWVKMFDLVVANTIVVAAAVERLSAVRIPVLWWIHESMASYDNPELVRHIPARLPEHISVYCVCNYARQCLLRVRPAYSIRILHYTMPDIGEAAGQRAFALPPHDGKKVLTLIGTLEPRKGHDILEAALNMLPEHVREQCFFVIVGRPCADASYETVMRMCRRYPDSVHYYEFLSRDEIYALHHMTDCLLCVSRDDPLPCVITEALSAGKPVISTENTGYAPILKKMHSGMIYGRDDPAELVACLETYIMNPDAAHEISSHARATYETYFSQTVFERSVRQILRERLNAQPEAKRQEM